MHIFEVVRFGQISARRQPIYGRRFAGFTLVEVLVVIGIIALLISVLLPSLAKARRSADQVQCAAALHQIGQFYQIYASSNRGKYPQQYNNVTSSTYPNGLPWVDWPMGNFGGIVSPGGYYTGSGPGLMLYLDLVKDPKVFFCPTLDKNDETTFFTYGVQKNNWMMPNGTYRNIAAGNPNWYVAYTSYVFWAGLGDPTYTNPLVWVDSTYMNEFAYSSTSLSTSLIASDMIGASTNAGWALKGNHIDGGTHQVPNARNVGTKMAMYGYGGNFLYNDGHVTWKRAEDCMLRYDSTEGGSEAWLAYP